MEQSKFYRLSQIAEMLQLNEQTVRKYVREGKLKAARFGREYRVSESDLNAFYESQRDVAS
jgi:excisionase family DNA binding protein